VGFLVGCDSPNQAGIERLDSDVVWIFTELSVILVIPTSAVRELSSLFSRKEAYFYAELLLVIPGWASRGL
jgi:hypothetical protein